MEENSVLSIYDCEVTAKHALILSEKTHLIREMNRSFRNVHLPTIIKIPIGSISNINKCKPEYMESYEQNESSTKKNNLCDEFSQ
jgi:hypothetical protein